MNFTTWDSPQPNPIIFIPHLYSVHRLCLTIFPYLFMFFLLPGKHLPLDFKYQHAIFILKLEVWTWGKGGELPFTTCQTQCCILCIIRREEDRAQPLKNGVTMHVYMLSHFSRVQLWDPKGCSLPGSSVQGILWAKLLEWVSTPSSRGSSQSRGLPSTS